MSIETMEAKLRAGGYPSLAQVESDCKRLVNNAKAFNDKKSLIYEDAERLRKTASNWMVKHNPAYRREGYVAVATPIPGEDPIPPGRPIPRVAATPRSGASSAAATPDSTDRPRRAAAAAQPTTPAPSRLRHSETQKAGGSKDFAGKTFQQAQEQLIREMIEYTDQDLQIFQPFHNLPSRSLKDYYQHIKHPKSLIGVQKTVRGVVGRNPPNGVTLYKSWDALAHDVELIWVNAKEYNEDGSDIHNLAIEFEEIFKKRLAEARAKVEEPPQQKLKINLGTPAPPKQQLKLKLNRQSPGSETNTPGAASGRNSATPGVIVHNEALQRQQAHVRDSMHSGSRPSSSGKAQTPAASNPFGGASSASNSIPSIATPAAKNGAASPLPTNGIKSDVQSPALNAIRPASMTSDSQRLSNPAQTPMPPPLSTSRPASGSPHPNGPLGHAPGSFPPHSYVPPVVPQFDNFRRKPLSNPNEAVIPKITITASPILNLPKPFQITIPPHKQKAITSTTLNLPPTHSYLHIVPSLPIALTNRAWRIHVSVNGNKIMESSRMPLTANLNGGPVGYDGGKKKGEPLYEAKLVPGMNRVDIEVIAERDRGAKGRESESEGKDVREKEGQVLKDRDLVDIEKCTIFCRVKR